MHQQPLSFPITAKNISVYQNRKQKRQKLKRESAASALLLLETQGINESRKQKNLLKAGFSGPLKAITILQFVHDCFTNTTSTP
ncbi:hypothetical protein GJV06_06215 [Enterobacteriaceae bacterium RIT691]|nr:hypothetical protein [Enterobacteriaceae bacterium RIT691]